MIGKQRVARVCSLVAAFNICAWVVALAMFRLHPLLLGTAFLAFTLGLRHGVDADHIAAIDSVTRKLMQERKVPVTAGLFFSLGHSTVVVGLSLVVALAASTFAGKLSSVQNAFGFIGTAISASFLFAIALVNVFVLMAVLRALRRQNSGESHCEQPLSDLLSQRGVLSRVFQPLIGLANSSWHMYPIGLLFGLGFDTATEVAVLGIAAVEGVRGLPVLAILIFPLLFTAGMSLVDTADGTLMLGAYGWAFASPQRKLYYNVTVTFASVVVSAVVGSIEAATLIGSKLNFKGWFWIHIESLSGHFGAIGLAIVGIFLFSWMFSNILWRLRGSWRSSEQPAIEIRSE